MSNTATTAMMIPIVLGVLGSSRSGGRQDTPFRAGMVLTVAYAASIGGIMTPVGSPPNLIMMGLLDEIGGVELSFVTFMLFGVPIAIVYAAFLFLFVGRRLPAPRLAQVESAPVARPWTSGQRNCAIAFGVAVTLWVLPGLVTLFGITPPPAIDAVLDRLDEGVVAVMAAGLLFVLPVDWKRRQFTLEWGTASRIDWGTILLFGGGLSLGQLMFSTGLAAYIGEGFVRLSGADSLWAITAVVAALAIVLSEVASNTAATSMLVPVVLAICAAAGINPVPPALAACFGASFGFMLPVATPPNAIAYGTGFVPVTTMMRAGLIMDIVGFVIVMVALRILCPLLGYA
jgi:sodium-dependent dicarboxylate transporter 2/3/5